MKARKFFVAILTMVVILVLATPSFAAGKVPPYKDATKKSLGKEAYNSLVLVYQWGGLEGLFGKNLNPYSPTARMTFLTILSNCCDDYEMVKIGRADRQKYYKPINAEWAVKKMKALIKRYGMKIRWDAPNTVLTNIGGIQYIAELLKSYGWCINPQKAKKLKKLLK